MMSAIHLDKFTKEYNYSMYDTYFWKQPFVLYIT